MNIAVARTPPSGTGELEPAREFYQDRLRLWAFWVFALSFGFYLSNLLTWPFVQRASATFTETLLQTGNLDHLAASLVFGGTWVLMRTRAWPLGALRAIDVTALLLGCTLFALMGASMARMQNAARIDSSIGTFAGLLACANTVMARAIAVPSTSWRTLLLSTAAMAPLLPAAAFATGGSPVAVINIANWCAVSIAVATVGSRVIFGLRNEAARAQRLGQYVLEETIGAGGMGVVYRARHAMLRRPTAIKLLPPERAGEASLLRFEREVQLTAQLSHPNTVAIYDYGRTPEGIFYYAMEFLDGVNLEELVRGYGPQPATRVVAILKQVCGALQEAHGRGLVHRDIKPANIILTERGGEPDVAKVVDFGLVKPLVSADVGLTASASTVLTGTPLYMAPETITSPDATDARSDLYALGAVGYFLLTGQPVFAGNTVLEVIGHHLHSTPVPPSACGAHSVPRVLEAVIMRCLQKRADDRPQSAHALREALSACAVEGGWTPEDATAWWQTFRSNGRPATGGDTPSTDLTMTVDVRDRLRSMAV